MTHQALISSVPAPAFSPASSHSIHASTPPILFTLSSSSSCPSSSAAAAAPAMASFVAHHHGSLGEREGRMAALRTSLRPCEAAEEVDAAAPAAWCAAERGAGLFGDGFSVEDLLDLDDLCEVDKNCAEPGEATPPAQAAVEDDKLSTDSHESSVVSYELVPLPTPPPAAAVIDLPLPAHDAEELEWVSRIMDDSLAELPPPPKLPAAHVAAAAAAARRPLERAAPASAAGPLRSPTICALSTEALVPVKARRSKRSRSTVWSLSGGSPLLDSSSSSSSSCSSSASFSSFLFLPADSPPPFWAAHLLDDAPPRSSKKSKHSKHGKNGGGGKPKKRGRKPKHHPLAPSQAGGGAGAAAGPAPGDRRCSHCGVNKTPQWRAGPAGAKTLCNACGVRYKSGRLLPEYRPACSPTFVSTIHSNSHRKVLEMRRKKEGVLLPLPLQGPATPPAPFPAAAPAVASF
ncbi:unnamed protein product [Urochloa decumbens]|uniref:GATA-type domain-containing protein n=1 Tax=Urochloa decumbens TaxID=240449 RepID=A0ABC8V9U5_9POAL